MPSREPASDLAISGGGPAGLALAIAARQRGLTVTLFDRARPPIDKACGEGIMPDGVAALARLGVRLDPNRTRPFRGIRFLDDEVEAAGDFPAGPGLGVRRTELHTALAQRAEALGARLRWGVGVRGLTSAAQNPGAGYAGFETTEGAVTARWLVAADGLHSPLRRAAGLDGRPARHRRFGVRRHFALEPWTDRVEVYWADHCEAYVTPVGPRRVGVAMLWSGEPARFDGMLARFPALGARLRGAAIDSADRGAGTLDQRVRAVWRGNLALLGDASGYVDAITGEGLALAFHQAAALADALMAEDLTAYARAHRHLVRLSDTLTRLLLSIERRPRARRRLLRTLARDPALFSRLLGVHSRALPAQSVGLGGALRLAGCLL